MKPGVFLSKALTTLTVISKWQLLLNVIILRDA